MSGWEQWDKEVEFSSSFPSLRVCLIYKWWIKIFFKPKLKVIIVGLTFPKEDRMVLSYWVPWRKHYCRVMFFISLPSLSYYLILSLPLFFNSLTQETQNLQSSNCDILQRILWEKWILKACLYTTKDAYVLS